MQNRIVRHSRPRDNARRDWAAARRGAILHPPRHDGAPIERTEDRVDDHDRRRRTLLAGALATAGWGLVSPARGAAGALLRRTIPASGETLAAVGLGTWQSFDIAALPGERAAARETLQRFAAAGAEVVDSSPMYGSSEAVLGELAAETGVAPRLFIATKVWTRGRAAGLAQMAESLRRLRVERIDLMQVHNLVDADTHLASLAEWKRAGRIRHAGVTHYQAGAHAELERCIATAGVDFLQVNYSMAEPQAGQRLLPAARDRGVAVLVNRPFAEGALFARVQGVALPAWAQEFGCASWAQFFLKWILADPAVTCAIPGTRNPRHLADNLAAAGGALPDPATRARMTAWLARL